MTDSNSIAAFALPKAHKLDLGNGVFIEFSVPSLGHIAQGELVFGTEKAFFAALQNESGAGQMLKAFWVLVENKASFKDDANFMAKFLTPAAISSLGASVKSAMADAMPVPKTGGTDAAGKSPAKPKKPKSTGPTSSAQSADTTAPTT